MKNPQDFIEKYYLGYDSCSKIARFNDLDLLVHEEEEEGSIASEILYKEFAGYRSHSELNYEHRELAVYILETAIQGYINNQGMLITEDKGVKYNGK